MKIAFISTLLLACTAFAAPVPRQIHHRLEKLEVTILNVINDINEGGSAMHKDYHAGLEQFKWLVQNLPGHKYPCGSLPSFQARSEDHVSELLSHSRRGLKKVVGVLAESSSPADAWVHKDLCTAYDHYRGAHPFIKSL